MLLKCFVCFVRENLLSARKLIDEYCSVPPFSTRHIFPMVVSAISVQGSHLHWSFPAVFHHVSGGQGCWSTFRSKTYYRLRSWLASFLPEHHLLDSPPYSTKERTRSLYSQAAWASLSTHALISVLLRFSGPFRLNGRIDKLESGSEHLLQHLLNCLPSKFRLLAKSKARWIPPHAIDGDEITVLPVEDNIVDLTIARGSCPALVHEKFPGLDSALESVPLLELLQLSPCFDVQKNLDLGFFDQFVWQLGTLLERSLIGLDAYTIANTSWLADGKHNFNDTLGSGSINPQLLLHGYCRKTDALLNSQNIIAIAFDDSRVARRNWKLVCVGWPELGQAAWLCPQVVVFFLPAA